MLSTALEYLARGWSVVPIRGKKAPCIDWKPYVQRLPTEAEVATWWTQWPDAWIGVALGPVSNLVRIDADGEQALQQLVTLGDLPPTAEFITPSGGRGWLYECPPGFTKTWLPWKGNGPHEEVRVQTRGAYTVLPPSPNYSWVNSQNVSRAPNWLWDQAVKLELTRLEAEIPNTVILPANHMVLEALKHLRRYDDRDSWIRVGMALHSAGDELLPHWIEWSRQSHKFEDGECEREWAKFRRDGKLTTRTILYWAREDGWQPPSYYEQMTDVGNGRVLARLCIGKVHYIREWETWVAWTGTHWKQKGNLETMTLAKQAVADRRARACKSLLKLSSIPDEATKKERMDGIVKVLKWCNASESSGRLHAAIDLCRSESNVAVDYRLFNQKPWLLNCPNGVLELDTGLFRDHDAEDYLTQLCPTEYHPDAVCPRWEQFLNEVFDSNAELISWIQRFLGYCLTGLSREHILPIFHGGGRNGKTTLIKTVCTVVGPDYAGTTPAGFLMANKGGSHPTAVADLYGKRLAADLETDADARLNETLIKRLTGGDELKARRMYEDFWSFAPTHKLILATNHEPSVQGTDTAIWARLKLVPFTVSFLGREDTSLVDSLSRETCGILRWMVDGCAAYVRQGLGEPAAVQQATAVYRGEQNDVARFLEANYRVNDAAKIRKTAVTAKYSVWCHANNTKQIGSKAFGMEFKKLGVKSDANFYFLEEVN